MTWLYISGIKWNSTKLSYYNNIDIVYLNHADISKITSI